MSEIVLSIQKQIDSLAVMVLQNLQGLDILKLKKVVFACSSKKKCCRNANPSRIVRNKIQELQSDIKNFRELETTFSGFFKNPIWKWILPFITPFLVMFLAL